MYLLDKNLFPAQIAKKVQKTYPVSLQGLISWLETCSPKGRYDWWDCSGHCLLGQFQSISQGREPGDRDSEYDGYYGYALTRKLTPIASSRPWTYGAALTRARAMLSESEQ